VEKGVHYPTEPNLAQALVISLLEEKFVVSVDQSDDEELAYQEYKIVSSLVMSSQQQAHVSSSSQ